MHQEFDYSTIIGLSTDIIKQFVRLVDELTCVKLDAILFEIKSEHLIL